MADLQSIEIADFQHYSDQETTQDASDVRLPPNLSDANYSGQGPLVLNRSGSGYNVKGLHPNVATSDAEAAVLYSTALAPSLDLISMIRMRTFGSGTDFKAAPACRIQSDGVGCYTAELTWNAGGSGPGSYTLEIVHYDASTGARTVLSSLVDALTEFPASSSNFSNRFYAIGIQAVGTGSSVTLNAFLHLLYFTEQPSLSSQWDLQGIDTSLTPVLTVADSSASRHVTGAHGIRWRSGTLSASEDERIVTQWGMFADIAGTRPDAPTITATTFTNQQKLTVVIDGFTDSDPLETHHSTRWLLYDDQNNVRKTFKAPLVDTGFLTGNKLTYTFADLDPMRRYAVAVQLKDSDGDVSSHGQSVGIEIEKSSSTEHLGYERAVSFRNRPAGDNVSGNGGFAFHEPGVSSLGVTLKTAVEAAGATSKGARITRSVSVPTGETRRFSYRDPRYVGGSSITPLYDTIMGTMVHVVWPDASGLNLFVRGTAVDANCYFLKKSSNGSNWDYQFYKRTLNSGGTSGPGPGSGPFTDTLLATQSVPKARVGSTYGERVVLIHVRDANGIGYLTGYVNGIYLGIIIPNEQQGGTDPGHQWHGFHVDDTNGSWEVHQYGVVAPWLALTPQPSVIVYPESDDQESQYHHPGPFMDAHDLGTDTIWYQQSGSWYVKAGASASKAFLVHWAARYTHYQYSVTAQIYGNNGVVARFIDAENYIGAYISGTGSSRTLNLDIVVGGVVVDSTSASITYSAGSQIVLQVFNDPNSNDILIRVFYDGTLEIPSSPSVTYAYTDGQSGVLVKGRGGVMYAENVTSTDVQVCDYFEMGAGFTVVEPSTPTATGSSGDAAVKVSTVLGSSSFDDPDGGTHTASQWQVTEYPSGVFTNPLWDSGEDASNLVSITVSPGIGAWRDVTNPGLDAATQYQYRVRHKDNSGLWSAWSSAKAFTTGTPTSATAGVSVAATYPGDPLPSQVFTEDANFNTKISVFESGKEQRRSKWPIERRSWKIKYENLTESQMDLFWDFFKARRGAGQFFTWVNPRTDEQVFVRFRNDTMSRELFEADLERTGLELVEVPL